MLKVIGSSAAFMTSLTDFIAWFTGVTVPSTHNCNVVSIEDLQVSFGSTMMHSDDLRMCSKRLLMCSMR